MRGDRPLGSGVVTLYTPATPHARGSTSPGFPVGHGQGGYPACAGIDPPQSVSHFGLPRLPRMRGDRPGADYRKNAIGAATPHARGSTRGPIIRTRCERGYPACAGIDPYICLALKLARGLPRMRGDRPQVVPLLRREIAATPHARGSTSAPLLAAPQVCGYPACAGIDRPPRAAASITIGLPRMRGDRPPVEKCPVRCIRATPHARGSTRSSESVS